MTGSTTPTVWVLRHQFDRRRKALERFEPGDCSVLLVESMALVSSRLDERRL